MSDIADSSLEVVVSTYLHCSCDDSLSVLKEVRRVLKPVVRRLSVLLQGLYSEKAAFAPQDSRVLVFLVRSNRLALPLHVLLLVALPASHVRVSPRSVLLSSNTTV
ncbi:hypothetical protein AVEN_67950-1 [Araneus ventricosus]|uniref:Uncharacterized protein n=1 Tax=Araneus ventricosus TaxID=182803 RepID=A0A4Y2QBI9_ARAVE|nr:hypothetical protein AVEN_67950-1 [Araneus ventricosus]